MGPTPKRFTIKKYTKTKKVRSSGVIGKQGRPHLQITRKNRWDNPTPRNKRHIKPIKLFRKIQEKHISYKERNEKYRINEGI